jgi:hypothetical protein
MLLCRFSLLEMPMKVYIQEKKLRAEEITMDQKWSHCLRYNLLHVTTDIPVSDLYFPSLSEAQKLFGDSQLLNGSSQAEN